MVRARCTRASCILPYNARGEGVHSSGQRKRWSCVGPRVSMALNLSMLPSTSRAASSTWGNRDLIVAMLLAD